MTPDLPLTPATEADLPALAALVNGAYRGETSRQGWTTEADLLGGTRTDEAELRAVLQDPHSTVLTCRDPADGALLGCFHLEERGDILDLHMLAVQPDLQARGVGKRLLAAAEDHARALGCRTCRMSVLDGRPELLAFYERRGYRRTGETEPFPEGPPHGVPTRPLTLLVLEKPVARTL
ncbi:GNAT family N-acetyltransferase [uncultured Hymenobacter sp.]|uniref:GNAT family N-acetyltransferase n=1 Tax=uncultured Hymenobacter sp. TaxID=170016 RepID=UPI0035C9DBA3